MLIEKRAEVKGYYETNKGDMWCKRGIFEASADRLIDQANDCVSELEIEEIPKKIENE